MQASIHSSSVASGLPQRRLSRIVPENRCVFLEHYGYLVPQDLCVVFADIHTAYTDRALVHIVETADQVHQTALARAGAADDADGLAAFDMEVDIGEGILPASVLIRKIHMVEINAARQPLLSPDPQGPSGPAFSFSTSLIRRMLAMDILIMTTTMESIIRLIRRDIM